MTQDRDTPAPQVSEPEKSAGSDSIAAAPLRSEARPLPAPDRPRTIPILRLGPEDALGPEADSVMRDEADIQPDATPKAVTSEVSGAVPERDSGTDPDDGAPARVSSTQSRETGASERSDTSETRLTDPVEATEAGATEGAKSDAPAQEGHDPARTPTPTGGPDDQGSTTSVDDPDMLEDDADLSAPDDFKHMHADAEASEGAPLHGAEALDDTAPLVDAQDTAESASATTATPLKAEEALGPESARPDPWAVLPASLTDEAPLAPEPVTEPAPETRSHNRSAQVPPPSAPARQRPACEAALFGKLPSRGDFIARSMPRLLQRPFEDWLIPLVQQTRTDLGGQWNAVWRGAGPWRFWIGPDVLGGSWQRDLRKAAHEVGPAGGAVTGVLLPSADRHGRDFPLVLVLADRLARLMPPPVTASPDRAWYDMCDDLLYAARVEPDISNVERALDHFPGPLLPEDAEAMDALLGQRALWAQGTGTRPDGTSQVWHDIAQADHHLAASQRSYWWQAPKAGAAQRVLSLAGLPDAGTFAFMLSQGHPDMSGSAP